MKERNANEMIRTPPCNNWLKFVEEGCSPPGGSNEARRRSKVVREAQMWRWNS